MTDPITRGHSAKVVLFNNGYGGTTLQIKADGKVERSIFDRFEAEVPKDAVLELGDRRLGQLLRTRDEEALGAEWECSVHPRDTARNDRAARHGQAMAIYRTQGQDANQEIMVQWHEGGGGKIYLDTEVAVPATREFHEVVSHQVEGRFDGSFRRMVMSENLSGSSDLYHENCGCEKSES